MSKGVEKGDTLVLIDMFGGGYPQSIQDMKHGDEVVVSEVTRDDGMMFTVEEHGSFVFSVAHFRIFRRVGEAAAEPEDERYRHRLRLADAKSQIARFCMLELLKVVPEITEAEMTSVFLDLARDRMSGVLDKEVFVKEHPEEDLMSVCHFTLPVANDDCVKSIRDAVAEVGGEVIDVEATSCGFDVKIKAKDAEEQGAIMDNAMRRLVDGLSPEKKAVVGMFNGQSPLGRPMLPGGGKGDSSEG